MSDIAVIEFVGGPLDGSHVAVRPGSMSWRVPMLANPRQMFTEAQSAADVAYRVGTYKPVTEADTLLGRWHWHEPKGPR